MPTIQTLTGLGTSPELADRLGEFTGTLTINGATPVVVSETKLTANHAIILTTETPGGTPAWYGVTARTNGTGFSVTGTAGDTSVVRYVLRDIR